MSATNICTEFSKGNFSATFNSFHPDIEWNIVGDRTIKGKSDVIDFCNEMTKQMSGTLTNTSVMIDDNKTVIEGVCDYTDENNNPGKVQYCDIYLTEGDQIRKISSYCITVRA